MINNPERPDGDLTFETGDLSAPADASVKNGQEAAPKDLNIGKNLTRPLAALGFNEGPQPGVFVRPKTELLPEIRLDFACYREKKGMMASHGVFAEFTLQAATRNPLFLLVRAHKWSGPNEIIAEIVEYLQKQENRATLLKSMN